ncbi:MAG: succinate dehydrogenase, cytochrome b556 subunit [Proteobacteria bacterium]|nr:succinate dehydrogenase, cytochrome b556 subunit [Pseudomonadota bacterium]
MPKGKRPLSPHLQVYRPQLTSILSIFHRITGVALAAGMVLLVAWLLAAGAGPGPFAVAQGLLGSWLGMVVLLGFSFALFFHLCNGVRHLFWDAGWGFELPQVYASGWSVVVVSILLTGAAWAFGLTMMGGGS